MLSVAAAKFRQVENFVECSPQILACKERASTTARVLVETPVLCGDVLFCAHRECTVFVYRIHTWNQNIDLDLRTRKPHSVKTDKLASWLSRCPFIFHQCDPSGHQMTFFLAHLAGVSENGPLVSLGFSGSHLWKHPRWTSYLHSYCQCEHEQFLVHLPWPSVSLKSYHRAVVTSKFAVSTVHDQGLVVIQYKRMQFRELVSWSFEPSQPLRIISGLRM